MLILLRDANVFAPAPLGRIDVLIANGAIAAVGPRLPELPAALCEEIDLHGLRLVPGLIDAHVHLTGGGGESGPASRVPPLSLPALTAAGITTVVGLLGTDGTTRTVQSLVARTLGLREEGLSAYCWTGSYEVPVRTLTGSVRGDLCFVDPIIGVGELALSDHRSSQPTLEELLRIAADCHVGGLMSGKAGVLHLHLGDGPRGLELVRKALQQSELPARVFHPTHVNRSARLLEEAFELTQAGCTIDVTAFPEGDDGLSAARAILLHVEKGLSPDRLTCSSDGAGCLPVFDAQGQLTSMDVGRPATLLETLRALLANGLPLEQALLPFTANVAALLKFARKGRIARGLDADLLILDEATRPLHLLARGQFLVRDGKVAPGRFPNQTSGALQP